MNKRLLTIIAAASLLASAKGAEQPTQESAPLQLQPKMELKNSDKGFSAHKARPLGEAKEIRKARPDLYSGRVIDAVEIYNSSWENLEFSKIPYGLYKMDMGTGNATPVVTDAFSYNFSAGAYSDTEFIGMRIINAFGMFNGLNFISIDTETKRENWNIMLSPDDITYADICSTMAYNPVEKSFYSINYNESMTGLYLCRFNPDNRSFQRYATWTGNVQPLTMAYTPEGVCYVIASDGALYTLNMKDGSLTKIGSTGVSPSMYNQAMTFDGTTGNFIWLSITNRGSRIYAVDPETAETEEIAILTEQQQFAAAYLPLDAAYYGAPAKVSAINFSGYGGALDASVSFSLPNTTFAGATMSGDLNYTVWVDGEPVAENVKGTAGQYVNIPVSLTEGNHVFSVVSYNKVGKSPVASATYWAGFDYPAAPAYVNLQADSETGMFNIDWAGVYEGQHKGYVDWQIKYNVYRMPGDVKVADGISDTNYSDPIPAEMKRYYYEVAAVNSDGKEGARMASNEMLQGNAATVPYYEGFDDDTYKGIWRFEDRSGNGRSWRFLEGEIIADMMTGANDMWAVVPPVALETGNKYQMILNLRQAWQGYQDRVKVYIGKKGDDLSNFREIADFTDEIPNDFADITLDFSVEENGAYEFGIAACAEENGSTIRISSVAIELIGKLGAPEAVASLTITPDADDQLEAEISFTAPMTNLSDEPLTSISRFDVMVDGEKAATLTGIAPGEAASSRISNISSVGKHVFTVIPFNENGQGKAATASQFIGCFTAPYQETFADNTGMEFWTSHFNFDTSTQYTLPMSWNQFDSALQVAWFANGEGEEAWAFSPDIKLDTESVYSLSFDFKNQHYGEEGVYSVNMGMGANPDSQSKLADMPMQAAYYNFTPVEEEVVTDAAGKYNFGFYSYSIQAYDYPSYEIRNVKLTYVTSAKAPYSVTDYKGVADKEGKLEADLTFKAPTVDFSQRTLSSLDKIEILRGDNGMVVKTFDNPAPGAEMTWHDNTPNYGKNTYTIVAYNSEGRGKIYTADLFVGEDVPVVENVTLTGSADNMSATLSWDRAEFGVNGGVLMDEDMTYQVFRYDAETGSATIVATISDTQYEFPAVKDKQQAYYFYGVMPVNEVNAGAPVILSVQLGELYTLPFAESFAEGIPASSLWSIYSQNPYISWQPINSFWDGYSAQDNDGGCIGFFNGNMYTNYAGDRLYSPKMTLGSASKATLTFYVLNARMEGSEDYPYPALLRVGISVDDSEFETITKDEDYEFDGSDSNWKKYEIDLTPYADSKHIRLCFDGYTNGGYELLCVDNISVTGEVSGIGAAVSDIEGATVTTGEGLIIIRNAKGHDVKIYNMAGIMTGSHAGADMMNIPADKGIYAVKIGEQVFKVQVK